MIQSVSIQSTECCRSCSSNQQPHGAESWTHWPLRPQGMVGAARNHPHTTPHTPPHTSTHHYTPPHTTTQPHHQTQPHTGTDHIPPHTTTHRSKAGQASSRSRQATKTKPMSCSRPTPLHSTAHFSKEPWANISPEHDRRSTLSSSHQCSIITRPHLSGHQSQTSTGTICTFSGLSGSASGISFLLLPAAQVSDWATQS